MLYGHEMGGDKTLLELLKESEKYKEKSGTEFDKLEKIFENYKENPMLEKVIKGNSSIYDVVSELIYTQFAGYFFEKNSFFDFDKADIGRISELLPLHNYLSKRTPSKIRRELLSTSIMSSCPPIFLTVLASFYATTPLSIFPIVAAGTVVTFLAVLGMTLFHRDALLEEHKRTQMKQFLDDVHYLDEKIREVYKK